MKTKKSLLKRLKITKNGKILGRAKGIGHFNARARRIDQLAKRKDVPFSMSNKEKRRFLPGLVKVAKAIPYDAKAVKYVSKAK
jgi:ribosomal protein L35